MPKKKASTGRTDRTATKGRAASGRKKAARKRSAPRRKAKAPAAPSWVEPFLRALQDTRSVSHACEAIGLGRSTVYDYRERDDAFRARWDEARWAFRDDLETSALAWAIDGLEEPVFARVERRSKDGKVLETRTEVVGTKVRRNAAVTLRMLECLYPERYGRDQGESDPHEAARLIREDLEAMVMSMPVAPPDGHDPNLVEPMEPGGEAKPPGQAQQHVPGQGGPATKRRAEPGEPEPPP